MAMNAVAQIEAPSVFSTMAHHYGMDKRAFEATLRATVMPANTSNEQAAAFLLVAREHGLNPFTREIFAFPAKGGGIQPVVSVDGWLKLINSHPQANGMEYRDVVDDKGNLVSITCRIFRKDRQHAIEVTEYMAECRRDTDTWKRWPARMLRHKATIQAARYAFGFAGIMEPDEAERASEVTVTSWGEQNIPAATIEDQRKQRCDDAAEQYGAHIEAIKAELAKDEPDAYAVAEAWREIPQAAQMDLWLAPTKGGVFTTRERDFIKTKLPKADSEATA
jgi:phage recombination protein Bet